MSNSLQRWLLPCSFLYGVGVRARNLLYNRGILKSKSYPIPSICIGNLAVGGSGKTPMVEYMVGLLSPQYKIAVISRGYGRNTHGLLLANRDSSASQIGDEPRQILTKYPDITLVVDGDRCRAMEYLLSLPQQEQPEVVILDDGYQHRAFTATMNILLTDFRKPFIADRLLPAGRLREPKEGCYRADMVIVTRSPQKIQPIEERIMERQLALYPHQQVLFSTIVYKEVTPLFPEVATSTLPAPSQPIVALAGIANPSLFFAELTNRYKVATTLRYRDHHRYRIEDLQKLEQYVDKGYAIITTEKDAAKLLPLAPQLSTQLKTHLYQQPIACQLLGEGANRLEQALYQLIHKHSTHPTSHNTSCQLL